MVTIVAVSDLGVPYLPLTHNSVLDGITNEITGLLLVLTEVTLECLNLSCQASTAIAMLLHT